MNVLLASTLVITLYILIGIEVALLAKVQLEAIIAEAVKTEPRAASPWAWWSLVATTVLFWPLVIAHQLLTRYGNRT